MKYFASFTFLRKNDVSDFPTIHMQKYCADLEILGYSPVQLIDMVKKRFILER